MGEIETYLMKIMLNHNGTVSCIRLGALLTRAKARPVLQNLYFLRYHNTWTTVLYRYALSTVYFSPVCSGTGGEFDLSETESLAVVLIHSKKAKF